jgi:hypothetical protein
MAVTEMGINASNGRSKPAVIISHALLAFVDLYQVGKYLQQRVA